MSTTINLVANDTQPPLLHQFLDSVTGLPYDLTSATRVAYAKFRRRGSTTTIFTQTCTKVSGGEALGQVQMTWPTATGLKNLTAGYYELEWYVMDGTDIQTEYDTTKCRVRKDFT